MSFLHNFFVRFFETTPAASNAKPPETPLTRAFDKPRNRIVLTGVLSVFLLANVILGGTAFKVTPSGVDGALAWQVVLSLFIWFYSLAFFWRNLDGASERRCTIFFWLNVSVGLLWLTGFFSLAIELGRTPDSLNYMPDGKTVTSYKPEIGCLVFDLFFCAVFTINAVYVFTRTKQLYPKYAEIHEEEQAFDATMTQGDYAGHGADEHDLEQANHDYDASLRPTSHTPPAGSRVDYNPAYSPEPYDVHPSPYQAPPEYELGPTPNYAQQAAPAPYPGASYPGRAPYPDTAYQSHSAEPRYPAQPAYQSHAGHQPYPSEGA